MLHQGVLTESVPKPRAQREIPINLQTLELCSLPAYIYRMKLLSTAIACAALCCLTVAAGSAEKQPVIAVRGPTVVEFFEPVPQTQLDKDPDASEALADFQLSARNVREPFRKAGIEFHEVYAYSFQLREGKRMTTFRPAKVKVGYYLVAPGMKPRIEYGVMTDPDLLQLAHEYFGIH